MKIYGVYFYNREPIRIMNVVRKIGLLIITVSMIALKTLSTTDLSPNSLYNLLNSKSIVIGILSIEKHIEFRNAMRRTWLSTGDFDYKFMFDNPTTNLTLEQNQYNDIIFLNTTFSGKAYKFGEKLLKWFKYARQHFPNAKVIVKSDDDVFLCPKQIIKSMNTIPDIQKIYYGYKHGNPNINQVTPTFRVDEMFVGIGIQLVDRIIKREYCTRDRRYIKKCPKNSLVDTDFGGTSLAYWLKDYDDINGKFDNQTIVHYSESEKFLNTRKQILEDIEQVKICSDFNLYHKAKPKEMYKLWDKINS